MPEASKNGSELLVTLGHFEKAVADINKKIGALQNQVNNLVNNQTQMDLRQDRTDNMLGEFRSMVEGKLIELFSGLEAASDMLEAMTEEDTEEYEAEAEEAQTEFASGEHDNEVPPVTSSDEDWMHNLLDIGEEVPPPPGADTNEEGDVQ